MNFESLSYDDAAVFVIAWALSLRQHFKSIRIKNSKNSATVRRLAPKHRPSVPPMFPTNDK